MELYAIKDIFEKYDDYAETEIIIKLKKYYIYSEFKSDRYNSNKGYIILCEDNKFRGYDSEFFITEKEMTAKKFNL